MHQLSLSAKEIGLTRRSEIFLQRASLKSVEFDRSANINEPEQNSFTTYHPYTI